MSMMEDVQKALTAAGTAQGGLIDAMAKFQSACITSTWDMTEAARAQAHDYLDAFFDNIAAAHRRGKG